MFPPTWASWVPPPTGASSGPSAVSGGANDRSFHGSGDNSGEAIADKHPTLIHLFFWVAV